MVKAVGTLAGTGSSMRLEHLTVAGKTGSAQAPALKIPVRHPDGKLKEWVPLKLGTHQEPNPDAPWYRGWGKDQDRRSHAWVIGFVPAEDPKLAFAVMVEYGGGGGATAGWVAHKMLEAAIEHGYLPKK
jgi:cell division protein FtsI/penicillin-binding protein 2